MITVKLSYSEGNLFCDKFSVSGHAETYSDSLGYDIVCSAVSAIVLTAALGLRDVLKVKGQFDSEIGNLKVDLNKKSTRETEIIIRTMLAGLNEISRQYPGKIKLIESRG